MVSSAATPRRAKAFKVALYAAAWYAGCYVEMGVPVFLALAMYALFTFGTGERWAGDASAYSVFNDGERITGTMTADQIDAQMRNGGHAPRAAASSESSFVQSALRGWGGGGEHSGAAPRRADASVSGEELHRRRAAAADAAQARASGTGT